MSQDLPIRLKEEVYRVIRKTGHGLRERYFSGCEIGFPQRFCACTAEGQALVDPGLQQPGLSSRQAWAAGRHDLTGDLAGHELNKVAFPALSGPHDRMGLAAGEDR